jgi:protein-disulfide isomerase
LRNAANLLVIATIGGILLIAGAAARAGSGSSGVILAQDDWVQVPSSGDSSPSQSTSNSTSQDSQPFADHPQRGGDNAAITIVEYSDFQCPYCRQEESRLRQVMKKYGDQVRLVYMDFPLAFHQQAMEAALAARCADEQGQFWAYHDALFEDSSGLSNTELKTTAAQLTLDSMSFDRCLDGRKYESAVVADRTQGQAAGVRGTPYFIVGKVAMDGAQPASALELAIDQRLRSR